MEIFKHLYIETMLGVISLTISITTLVILIGFMAYMLFVMKKRNSLVDLNELKDLDKDFKRNYREVVVNGILPEVLKQVNIYIKDIDLNTLIQHNKDKLIFETNDTLPIDSYSKNIQNIMEPYASVYSEQESL